MFCGLLQYFLSLFFFCCCFVVQFVELYVYGSGVVFFVIVLEYFGVFGLFYDCFGCVYDFDVVVQFVGV